MSEPTVRQLEVLVAYIEAGSAKKAARDLGVNEHYVRGVLSVLHTVYGGANTAQTFAIAIQRGDIDPHGLRLPNAA